MNDTEKLKHFAACCIAAAEGKIIQENFLEGWKDGPDQKAILSFNPHFADRLRIKPFALPALPEGQRWIATAFWAEGMLADGERPLLVNEVVQDGDTMVEGRHNSYTVCDSVGKEASKCDHPVKTTRPLPWDEIAPGHNPCKLTVGQVGEGWRIVSQDEGFLEKHSDEWWDAVSVRDPLHDEMWNPLFKRLGGNTWRNSDSCLRTRLTREALAALDRPKKRAWSGPDDLPPLPFALRRKNDGTSVTVVEVGKTIVAAGLYRYTYESLCSQFTHLDGSPLEVEVQP